MDSASVDFHRSLSHLSGFKCLNGFLTFFALSKFSKFHNFKTCLSQTESKRAESEAHEEKSEVGEVEEPNMREFTLIISR